MTEANAPAQPLPERIRQLAEELIAGTDYFLVDVNVRGHRGTRVVEVYVDGDAGIGHDNLATISRELGFLLEVEEVVQGGYTLDVSSPGIKRPLTMPRQYKKNVGRSLRVKYDLDDGRGTQYEVVTLIDATDEAVVIEHPDETRETVPYDAIARAKIELPW
ncbi:ribosome maturation factor RimP [Salisaeta longa]|uniref:ribosome maturation factor RimP n=1 Tax=Salisaeta longa TaxID=503170 RepID=UPI0003B38A8E|nr:ribosome maturation factor [Salisaeta longa]